MGPLRSLLGATVAAALLFPATAVAAGGAAPQPTAAPKPAENLVRHVRNHGPLRDRTELIVLHTTESRDRPGVVDLGSLAAWFDRRRARASSQVGNDRAGASVRMVDDDQVAWTQMRFNAVSVSIEQIGYARFSREQWMTRRLAQLNNTAAWIAYWADRYGLPIRRAVTSRGQVLAPGVAAHSQLGRPGGGHDDPGPGYPWDYVLRTAQQISGGQQSEPS